MDGSTLEHSDSDSGESWTLLDSSPSYADDAPAVESPESQPPHEGEADFDRDEDTDGISIISDSDPESAPCELTLDQCSLHALDPPPTQHAPFSATHTPNSAPHHGPVRSDDDDLLGDNSGKTKIYVHRRNKRLSTVLNIIVLGSIITAAGVALGHMWGARNDCLNAAPSVNNILTNLYKLQEENAYLRSKLKEFTFASTVQMLQRRDRFKNNKCKKVFEESLDIKNPDQLTKCVDNEYNNIEKMPEYEKEFLADIDKLKNIYQQNKSWLDDEISKRMKHESQYASEMKSNLKSRKSIKLNDNNYAKDLNLKRQPYSKDLKDVNLKRPLEAINELPPSETEITINVTEPAAATMGPAPVAAPLPQPTYADLVRSENTIKKRDTKDFKDDYKTKRFNTRKIKQHKDLDVVFENYMSDDEVRKDDRYVQLKFKPERKKNDRQKTNKKQKRRNKYEQWEMKGGYLKDYDDFSISSTQENEFVLKNVDKNFLSRDFEKENYINQFIEDAKSKGAYPTLDKGDVKSKGEFTTLNKTSGKKNKEKDSEWYEKRAALRTEARRKLEQELFGDSSPNNASWYFRRMQRREQCRVKGDANQRKLKRANARNFKTKH